MIKMHLVEHRENLRDTIDALTQGVNYEDGERREELQDQIRRLSGIIDACRDAGLRQTENGMIEILIECVQFANAERHDNRELVGQLQSRIKTLKEEFRQTERLISLSDHG